MIKQEDRLQLYKLLASSNNIIANVISRLGILEGSDAAWEDDDADASWRALRRDFEIMGRFKDLDQKVCHSAAILKVSSLTHVSSPYGIIPPKGGPCEGQCSILS